MRCASKTQTKGKEEEATTTNDISERSVATAASEVRLSTTSSKKKQKLNKNNAHTQDHTDDHTYHSEGRRDTNIILRIYLQFNIFQRSESANLAIAELHDK